MGLKMKAIDRFYSMGLFISFMNKWSVLTVHNQNIFPRLDTSYEMQHKADKTKRVERNKYRLYESVPRGVVNGGFKKVD
jgi:hypothetical protein